MLLVVAAEAHGPPIIPGNPITPTRAIATLLGVKGTGLVSGASYYASGTSIFEHTGPPITPSGFAFTAAFHMQQGPPIFPGNPGAGQIAFSLPISVALSSTGQIASAVVRTAGILWMGNDCVAGVASATDTAGNVLEEVQGAADGIASDGANLSRAE